MRKLILSLVGMAIWRWLNSPATPKREAHDTSPRARTPRAAAASRHSASASPRPRSTRSRTTKTS